MGDFPKLGKGKLAGLFKEDREDRFPDPVDCPEKKVVSSTNASRKNR